MKFFHLFLLLYLSLYFSTNASDNYDCRKLSDIVEKKNNLPNKISEIELRKMTDKEFYDYCSKIRKKLIEVTKEEGEFEVY